MRSMAAETERRGVCCFRQNFSFSKSVLCVSLYVGRVPFPERGCVDVLCNVCPRTFLFERSFPLKKKTDPFGSFN